MTPDFNDNIEKKPSDGAIKVNITTTHGTPEMLVGKYSESFVAELASQITERLSSSLGVFGFAESSVEIDMVFSPESFMEHTTGGVTYRRLLMSAKGCAPRDFWVKWQGKDGEPLSCANEVSASDIEFSLGEDVPHKVREREYRYLVHGNSDKYRTAMGKKNITEWRDLIKRAVKRGELTKETVGEAAVSQHSEEVADKLTDLLKRFNINIPKEESIASEQRDDIAELAKSKLIERNTPYEAQEEKEPTEAALTLNEVSEAGGEVESYGDINADAVSDEDFVGDFISSLEISAEDNEEAESVIAEDEPPFEIGEDAFEAEEELPVAAADSEHAEEAVAVPRGGYDIPIDGIAFGKRDSAAEEFTPYQSAPTAAKEDECEILRARLSEEVLSRSEAEERLNLALAERDAAQAELDNIKAALLAVRDTLGGEISELRAERDALKAKLELEEAAHRRDKELFAEAARQAKEESERIVREREAELLRSADEAARLRVAEQRAAEAAREEEIRLAEIQRIERDIRNRSEDKRTALERAQEQSRAMEREALLRVQSIGLAEPKREPSPEVSVPTVTEKPEESAVSSAKPIPVGPENHPYTSVSAKLIFRHNVDPNVKGRLYEIISRALEYYKKEHVYIKLKASIPEPAAVMLDFEQFPEGEDELLRGIVKLIGNSDLGVMKIIVE